MRNPFLIAQLSDPHLGAEWPDRDAAAGLTAAVESVRSMRRQPDAVLVSGDLADNPTNDEYDKCASFSHHSRRRCTFARQP